MKRLNGTTTEQYELEVVECDCGYHMGIDATYLTQVGEVKIRCPSCGVEIDTNLVCPEEESEPSCSYCMDYDPESTCPNCGLKV